MSWDLALDFFVFITEMEYVYCAVRTETLTIIQINFSSWDLTTAQAVSFRSHTAEARFQSQVNSCEICGGRSGNGSGSSLSTWGFRCQYYPISTPNSSSFPFIFSEWSRANPRNIPKINKFYGNLAAIDRKVLSLSLFSSSVNTF